MAWNADTPGAYAYGASERPYTQNPFFDFIRLVDGSGGVDHRGFYSGFPFGGPGSYRTRGGGRHGRGGGRHRGHGPNEPRDSAQDPEKSGDAEKSDDPEQARDSENAQDPPEVAPENDSEPPHGARDGHRRCGRGRGGRHGHHGRHGPPPFPFDPSALGGLFNHPLAQGFRDWAEQARTAGAADPSSSTDAFTPPLDVFESENEYVLHLALPGAKKDDVGVHWDADKGELRVSGVVHRPGDEAFLLGMRSSERRVGEFGRTVKLPPTEGASRKEDVDGDAISAKMEDGVLIIVVPKVEKDGWTEVRKVDIE